MVALLEAAGFLSSLVKATEALFHRGTYWVESPFGLTSLVEAVCGLPQGNENSCADIDVVGTYALQHVDAYDRIAPDGAKLATVALSLLVTGAVIILSAGGFYVDDATYLAEGTKAESAQRRTRWKWLTGSKIAPAGAEWEEAKEQLRQLWPPLEGELDASLAGITIASGLDLSPHVEKKIAAANAATFSLLRQRLIGKFGLPPLTAMRVVDLYWLSRVCYGMQLVCYATCAAAVARLRQAHRALLHIVLGWRMRLRSGFDGRVDDHRIPSGIVHALTDAWAIDVRISYLQACYVLRAVRTNARDLPEASEVNKAIAHIWEAVYAEDKGQPLAASATTGQAVEIPDCFVQDVYYTLKEGKFEDDILSGHHIPGKEGLKKILRVLLHGCARGPRQVQARRAPAGVVRGHVRHDPRATAAPVPGAGRPPGDRTHAVHAAAGLRPPLDAGVARGDGS